MALLNDSIRARLTTALGYVDNAQGAFRQWWQARGYSNIPDNDERKRVYVNAGVLGTNFQDIERDFWGATQISTAEAYYLARMYTGVTPQYLKDLSGNGHHMKLGSVARADIVDGALCLNGVAGQDAETPDDNSLDILGDFDLICKVAPDSWTGAAGQVLISKGSTAAAVGGYTLLVTTTGTLRCNWTDGVSAFNIDSTVVVPGVVAGAYKWVRATLDVDDGAGNNVVSFYSSTDGITWSAVGTPVVTVGVTSVANSATKLALGALAGGGGGQALSGKIARAIVKNGINGTIVFDADFSQVRDGTPWFLGATGKRITVQPTRAAVVGGALWLPGVSGQNAMVGDHPSLDGFTEVDLVWFGSLDDWTPAANNSLAAKENSAGTARSWRWQVTTAGALTLLTSTDGVALTTATSTASVAAANGASKWLRATWRASDGRVQFFTGDDGRDWTQLGSDRTGVVGTMANTDSPLTVGTRSVSSDPLAGKVFRTIAKSGIDGTTVFDFNPGTWNDGDGMGGFPHDESTGKCVSILSDVTGADTNDPKWLKYGTATDCTGKGLYLPGVSGNYASVPNAANLQIVGDITLDAEVSMDDWTPATSSTLVGKRNTLQEAYQLRISAAGVVQIVWFTATVASTRSSTVAVPVVDGQRIWVRATLDVDNGAAGHDAKFFYSYDGTTWVQLGTTVTTGIATTIDSTTAPVEVGTITGGTAELVTGRVFRARIWNAYTATGANPAGGNLILDADFTLTAVIEPFASFVTTSGQTVTINRSTTGRKSAVVDRPMFLFGTDDYMECADHAALDFALANSFSLALAARESMSGNAVFFAKKNAIGDNLDAGYILYRTAAATTTRVSDGALGNTSAGGELADGMAGVVVGVRSVTNDNITTYVDTVAAAAAPDTTTATSANALPLRIGRAAGAATLYADMEFLAAALWRLALDATDVARLDAEFGTNA